MKSLPLACGHDVLYEIKFRNVIGEELIVLLHSIILHFLDVCLQEENTVAKA